MSDQPLDTAALRAMAKRILADTTVIPFTPAHIDAYDWCNVADPATVLLLLDRLDALEADQLQAINVAFDKETEIAQKFYELNIKKENHQADIETHYQQQLWREKNRHAALVQAVLRGEWNEAARLAKESKV